MASRGWRDAHLVDLARRLYDMRSWSPEECSSAEEGMLCALEQVVEPDLYMGDWLARDHLTDQLDNNS